MLILSASLATRRWVQDQGVTNYITLSWKSLISNERLEISAVGISLRKVRAMAVDSGHFRGMCQWCLPNESCSTLTQQWKWHS